MTDPSLINTEQTYCWNTEVQQDVKYYPIPQVSNYPDYTQPSNYNSPYSYNVPPPNVSSIPPFNVLNIPPPNISNIPPPDISNIPSNISNIPPPDISNIPSSDISNIPPNILSRDISNISPPNVSNIPSDVNTTNSMYHFASTSYHNDTNFSNNNPYQNQMDPQCSDQYYSNMESAQYMGENNANWNVKTENVYDDNAGNEWYSNNSSTSWTSYTPAPWYDTSVMYENKKSLYSTQVYESSQKMDFQCNYNNDNKEMQSKHAVSSQSSQNPHSKQEKMYRSQYEDHRDRYRQHSREVSSSRDSTYDNRQFERSLSKRYGSYTSRSEESYVSNKYRKRSISQESNSRDTILTNNSKRTKGPTEREILLEKYR